MCLVILMFQAQRIAEVRRAGRHGHHTMAPSSQHTGWLDPRRRRSYQGSALSRKGLQFMFLPIVMLSMLFSVGMFVGCGERMSE